MWRAAVEGRSVEEGAPCQSEVGARELPRPWAMCCSRLPCDEGGPADSWVHNGLAPVYTKTLSFLSTTCRQIKLNSLEPGPT